MLESLRAKGFDRLRGGDRTTPAWRCRTSRCGRRRTGMPSAAGGLSAPRRDRCRAPCAQRARPSTARSICCSSIGCARRIRRRISRRSAAPAAAEPPGPRRAAAGVPRRGAHRRRSRRRRRRQPAEVLPRCSDLSSLAALPVFLDGRSRAASRRSCRDLDALPLQRRHHGRGGLVRARRVRPVVRWAPGYQIFPVSPRLTAHFHSRELCRRVAAARQAQPLPRR